MGMRSSLGKLPLLALALSTFPGSLAGALASDAPIPADDAPKRWQTSATLTFAINKDGIHDRNGQPAEKVFQHRYLGVLANATYGVRDWLGVGAFAMLERGSRTWSDFGGLDASGTPVLSSVRGGPYTMLWLGPMIQPRWKSFFLEIGYVLFGIRDDQYRGNVAT
jgi:hypothetical protein